MKLNVDWKSADSVVMAAKELSADEILVPMDEGEFGGLVWFSSSGSTGGPRKWWGLTRLGLLASAEAVNDHLKVESIDKWANVLPHHHVGGFGIWARAHQSQTEVMDWSDEKWDPTKFHSRLRAHKITLTSLVPTQIYDLIQLGLKAPENLKAVVVGGAHLEDGLLKKARVLNWPILVSFGMTECASQVATARLNSTDLALLNHIEARVDQDQRLWLKSMSAAIAVAERMGSSFRVRSSLEGGWLKTSDRAELRGSILIPKGRITGQIKILGELVDLESLRASLSKALAQVNGLGDWQLIHLTDERRGYSLLLVLDRRLRENFDLIGQAVDLWNQSRPGFERISKLVLIEHFPKSDLAKIDLRALGQKVLAQESSQVIRDRKFF